jgi:hypothetical protein
VVSIEIAADVRLQWQWGSLWGLHGAPQYNSMSNWKPLDSRHALAYQVRVVQVCLLPCRRPLIVCSQVGSSTPSPVIVHFTWKLSCGRHSRTGKALASTPGSAQRRHFAANRLF